MSTLTRKDPQKFFTLNFPGNGGEETKTTKVPARKGKTLMEVILPILESHDLSFDTHSLFLDSSRTPLPTNSDTFPYGGHTLYIRENEKLDVDKRIISLMKSDSKKSTSGPNKRFSELLEQLSADVGDDDVFDGFGEEMDDDFFSLEDSWNDIIFEDEAMPNRQKVQQQAIWELFTTEISYIKDLMIITEIFQKSFRALQSNGFMSEVQEELIFANIREVFSVNVTFWGRLKKIVENARITKEPILPSHLLESFDDFENLFQPYIPFCNADTSNMKLPEYCAPTMEMMKHYISWCDKQEQCKRITMQGFLIKPLQRVTKYSLLLRAILNKTDDEVERSVAEEMRLRVETFVSKINSAVCLRQEQEKLDSVINRFFGYNPAEPFSDEVEKIVKDFCNLNFRGCMPGLPEDEKRFILKEGPMKLVEKHGKKDVYGFLFTDVFVITKLKRNIDKFRIIRQPFRLNKIVVRVLKDPSSLLFIYLNEYGVMVNAFILQMTIEELGQWKVALETAKSKYEVIRTEFGLRDQFLDDDLPGSTVSTNKILSRHAAIKKRKPSKQSEENVVEKVEKVTMPLEWDSTLTLVGVSFFVLLNIAITRFFGWA